MENENNNTNTDEQNKGDQGSAPNGSDENKDAGTKENMIPKSRFDDINVKYKEMKEQLDEMMAAKSQEDVDAKKKQGEFEELYNTTKADLDKFKGDNDAAKGRVESLEGIINQMLETKLQSVPEEFRDLVPEGLSAENKLSWLAQAESKGLFGTQQKKSDTPLGGSTNPGSKQNTDLNKLSPMELLKAAYSSTK